MKQKTWALLLLIATVLVPLCAKAEELNDPIEPFNRAMFWFNDKLYVYLLRPVSKGYDFVVPDPVQNGVKNFFSNIRYPIYLVSDVVQLKFDQAATHTGRFLINTTLGVGGLVDVAKHLDLHEHDEDFGSALGHHGVDGGAYIVLPILGPSNVRDAFGRIVDTFLNPLYYVSYTDIDGDTKTAIIVGSRALEAIDDVNRARSGIDSAKKASLDYYLFVQSAYNTSRQNLIYDNNPPVTHIEGEENEPQLDQ